jgi:hypothetical protein
MLNAAISLLRRYMKRLRYPEGVPPFGSETEREPLLVGVDATKAGRPMQPGVNQRIYFTTLWHLSIDCMGPIDSGIKR